ncbi:hypothetical protein BBK36DRAFT_1145073 [Trichoderma citrinoviride]|uniref:Uncharacterized protein n=1 Tax=Trichoderma citrinoviride TaxID=58853 RepID=A0A2T4AYY9_9HYPO|nr:hypothetical protein BBK36DRAFT_1145073 [Trichoderma citrinoviride]PTB62287.1 hypothetical protein BBK36DRAFT_1145073 [Trichoderma citrinoviride]
MKRQAGAAVTATSEPTSRSAATPQSLAKPTSSPSTATSQQPKKQAKSSGDTSQASSQRSVEQASSQLQTVGSSHSTASSEQATPPTEQPSHSTRLPLVPDNPHLDRYAGKYIFTVEVAVSGYILWGRVDLGPLKGIFFLDERPEPHADGSTDGILIKWCGYAVETSEFIGDYMNGGWIMFYGDGKIEAFIDFDDLGFAGNRGSDGKAPGAVEKETLYKEWGDYQRNARLTSKKRWRDQWPWLIASMHLHRFTEIVSSPIHLPMSNFRGSCSQCVHSEYRVWMF